jgi:hypothetical protein
MRRTQERGQEHGHEACNDEDEACADQDQDGQDSGYAGTQRRDMRIRDGDTTRTMRVQRWDNEDEDGREDDAPPPIDDNTSGLICTASIKVRGTQVNPSDRL